MYLACDNSNERGIAIMINSKVHFSPVYTIIDSRGIPNSKYSQCSNLLYVLQASTVQILIISCSFMVLSQRRGAGVDILKQNMSDSGLWDAWGSLHAAQKEYTFSAVHSHSHVDFVLD